MSSNRLLMELGGSSFVEFLPTCCNAWYGGLRRVMGAVARLRYVSQVATIGGLSLPGAYGPNRARITSNN